MVQLNTLRNLEDDGPRWLERATERAHIGWKSGSLFVLQFQSTTSGLQFGHLFLMANIWICRKFEFLPWVLSFYLEFWVFSLSFKFFPLSFKFFPWVLSFQNSKSTRSWRAHQIVMTNEELNFHKVHVYLLCSLDSLFSQ